MITTLRDKRTFPPSCDKIKLVPFFAKHNLPPLDECPLSLGSLESDITDAMDEFSEPLERDNSFAMSSNVLGVFNFSLKKLLQRIKLS